MYKNNLNDGFLWTGVDLTDNYANFVANTNIGNNLLLDPYNTPPALYERAKNFDNFIHYTWFVLNFNKCAKVKPDGTISWYEYCDRDSRTPYNENLLRELWQVYASVSKTHGEYFGDNKERVIDEILKTKGYPRDLVTNFLNELEWQWRGTPQRIGTDMFLYPHKFVEKGKVAVEEGKDVAQEINEVAKNTFTEEKGFLATVGDFFSGLIPGLETTGKIMFWVIIVGIVTYLGYLLYQFWNIKKAVA